jgi:hypothetical protein
VEAVRGRHDRRPAAPVRAAARRADHPGAVVLRVPNRNHGLANHWGRLLQELEARMILVEFKNYDKEDVGKDEVNQTRNYLTKPMGRLALVVSAKSPNHAAHLKRNTIYSEDGKVIVFLNVAHLHEMLHMKERGEDPADLIMDVIERFYIEWE